MKIKNSFKVAISLLCVMAMLASSLLTFTLPAAAEDVTTTPSGVPTDLTNLTWSDVGFNGIYTAETSNAQTTEQADGMLIEGYVTLTGDAQIRVAGIKSNWNWGGIIFSLSEDRLKMDGSVAIPNMYNYVQPSAVGLSSVTGTEFLLQMSIEYVDNDGDGAEDDLKYGVWANGAMITPSATLTSSAVTVGADGYLYLNNHTDYLTTGMMVIPGSGSVSLYDYQAFPEGLTEYGWGEMGNGNAGSIVLGESVIYTGNYYAYSTDAAAVNNTIFNGDMIIPTASGPYIRLFDNSTGWYGVQMRVDPNTGSLVFENAEMKLDSANGYYLLTPSKFGLTTFVNTQFNLKMAITNRADDGSTATLTVWINDYFAVEMTLSAASDKEIGSQMIAAAGAGGDTVFTPCATTKPMPVDAPDGLTEVTWAELGFNNGGYTGHNHSGYKITSDVYDYMALDDTLFNGYVSFSGEGDLRWLGYDGWQGLLIIARADGYLEINAGTYGTSYSQLYKPAYFGLAGATFIGQEFNLKISTQIEGDNFTFGVWVNDRMAGDYFTLAKGGTPGSHMGVYDRGNGCTITLRSAARTIPLETSLTEIAWGTFGLSDSMVPSNGTTYSASTVESMNNTVFNGDVAIPEGSRFLYAGATKNAWAALDVRVSGGTLAFSSNVGTYNSVRTNTVDLASYGLSAATERFNLKIALTEMGDTSVKVTGWVNDLLAINATFTYDSDANAWAGFAPWLLFESDSAVVYEPSRPITYVAPEVLVPSEVPTDLKEITFIDYGVEDNAYSSDLSGAYAGSIDGTLFSGYVTHSLGNHFRLGGTADTSVAGGAGNWGGLIYHPTNSTDDATGATLVIDGSVAISDWSIAVPASSVNMTSFLNGEYFLQQSIEFIDYDDDGTEDDLKLGIWINGVMVTALNQAASGCANDGYVYVTDGAATLGSLMLVCPSQGESGGTVTVRSTTKQFPSDYTVYTPAGVGIADDIYTLTNEGGVYTLASGAISDVTGFNDSALVFEKVSFDGCLDMNFFGQTNDLGFKWRTNADGTVTITSGHGQLITTTLTDDVAGVDLVGGERYKLAFTLHYLTDTVVELGVWFNDVLYNNRYFTVDTDVEGDKLGNTLFAAIATGVGTTATMIVGNVVLPETLPTDYTVVDNLDFDIANGSYTAPPELAVEGKWTEWTSWDKVMIEFDQIHFEGTPDLNFGGISGWEGFKLRANADGSMYFFSGYGVMIAHDAPYTMTDDIAGVDLVGGDPYKLQITMAYTDDTKTSMKVGFWFNGVLYNNEYFIADTTTASDGVGSASKDDEFGSAMGVSNSGTVTMYTEIILETLPTDYTVVHTYDMGLLDAIYHYNNTDYAISKPITDAASVDEHILAFDNITFKGSGWLSLAATSTLWNSLKFNFNADGTASMSSGHGQMLSTYPFTDDVAGVNIVGGTYDLKFSFDMLDDGTANVGVWFNDVLYNNEYINVKVTDLENDAVGTYLGLFCADMSSSIAIQSDIWPELPGDMESINPSHFGLEDNTVYNDDANGTYAGVTTLLGLSFRGNVTFIHDGTGNFYICYGGAQGDSKDWYGLRLYLIGDTIKVESATGEFSNTYTVYPADFGLTTFLDDELELGIDTVEYGDDVLLYFYVDDVLYNNRPMLLDNFAVNSPMGNTIVLHSSSDNSYYTIGTIVRELPDLYHNLLESDYVAADGQTITLPVEKEVTYSDGAFTFVQTVIAYIPGDTNGDGSVDVADAVQIKLILAGTDFGKLAAKAADYDTELDGAEEEDLTNVRRTVLGYELAEKGDVMPIVGFFGPANYTYTDSDGTVHTSQYDMLTDEMYQTVHDLGINEISYSQQTYSNSISARTAVYEMLTLAQNYGIDMYINDSRLSGTTSYTSAQLAEYFANYENFQSYEGLFLMDEPSGTTYPYTTGDRLITDYAALGTAANNYKRGDVFVYANLLPYWLSLGRKNSLEGWLYGDAKAAPRYMTYVREYVEQFDMQYISYDYYPFDDNDSLEGNANVQTSEQYFKNMAMIRAVAKEEGIPFRPFVQAGTNWNDSAKELAATTNDTPTEGEFKWSVTSALAMGAQGIQYFTLIQPEWFALTEGGTMDYERNGLIGADGQLTVWGEYANEINAHVADVDHVLMAATHEGIMASGGYAQSCATAAIDDIYSNITTTTTNPVVTSYNEVTGISSSNSTYGALAGCFDYNGQTALYVCNYDANDSTADTITVSFSSAVDYTVIATTGTSTGNGTSASFTLGAGEGALIVLG